MPLPPPLSLCVARSWRLVAGRVDAEGGLAERRPHGLRPRQRHVRSLQHVLIRDSIGSHTAHTHIPRHTHAIHAQTQSDTGGHKQRANQTQSELLTDAFLSSGPLSSSATRENSASAKKQKTTKTSSRFKYSLCACSEPVLANIEACLGNRSSFSIKLCHRKTL